MTTWDRVGPRGPARALSQAEGLDWYRASKGKSLPRRSSDVVNHWSMATRCASSNSSLPPLLLPARTMLPWGRLERVDAGDTVEEVVSAPVLLPQDDVVAELIELATRGDMAGLRLALAELEDDPNLEAFLSNARAAVERFDDEAMLSLLRHTPEVP